MSKKKKTTFVVVIPRFEDIFHSYFAGEIIKGVSLSASRLNADFLVHIVDRGDHRLWLAASFLDQNDVDGIIFADIDNDINIVKKAINHGLPCIVLNNILLEPINYVAVNNKKAAIEVVERGGIRSVWLQEGVSSQEAEDFAEDYGLTMVTNFCIMEAYKKLDK